MIMSLFHLDVSTCYQRHTKDKKLAVEKMAMPPVNKRQGCGAIEKEG